MKATFVLSGGCDPPELWDAALKKAVRFRGARSLKLLYADWGGQSPTTVAGLMRQTQVAYSLEQGVAAGGTAVQVAHPFYFSDQITWADLVLMPGGTTQLYMKHLAFCPGWQKSLGGKVVVGLSAGANILSRRCYGLDAREVLNTGGPVPCQMIVHWKSDYGTDSPNGPIDWAWASKQLSMSDQRLPVVTLGENEWRAFEVEVTP